MLAQASPDVCSVVILSYGPASWLMRGAGLNSRSFLPTRRAGRTFTLSSARAAIRPDVGARGSRCCPASRGRLSGLMSSPSASGTRPTAATRGRMRRAASSLSSTASLLVGALSNRAPSTRARCATTASPGRIEMKTRLTAPSGRRRASSRAPASASGALRRHSPAPRPTSPRKRGARAVEGYPVTTNGAILGELHVGTAGMFAAAGFSEVSRRRPGASSCASTSRAFEGDISRRSPWLVTKDLSSDATTPKAPGTSTALCWSTSASPQ